MSQLYPLKADARATSVDFAFGPFPEVPSLMQSPASAPSLIVDARMKHGFL
jgi:hypothetical protein